MSDAIGDPRKDAVEYLESHKVFRLFDIIGAKLTYAKPEDPNAFIVSELSKMAAMASRGQPVTVFTEQDIEVMFTVFDITNRGYLTQPQYSSALAAVGVAVPQLQRPQGEKIDKKAFVSHVFAEVAKNSF